MKINEKNLIYFATSNTPVDKEGWLLKRGDVSKSFQKRYFVLKGNLLFYFDKKFDREPAGLTILEGCTIELAENEEQYAFKIVFHGAGDRTYIFGAETQDLMESWMKALACASYDYMKMMVSELQRQLDELTDAERRSQPGHDLVVSAGIATYSSDSSSGSFSHNHTSSSSRQRLNPFNAVSEQEGVGPENTNQESLRPPRKSFRELHEEYGKQIRENMLKATKGQSLISETKIVEDSLI